MTLTRLLAAALLACLTSASGPAQSGADFGPAVNLGSAVNSPSFDGGPSLSADGLSLYFTSDRPGGAGGGDLWIARRATTRDPFGAPTNLGPGVNSDANEFAPSIAADGLTIYFDSDRPGGLGSFDIWMATRATTAEPFGSARNLGAPANTAAGDGLPSISLDGSSLHFSSRRTGGAGGMDLWVARRDETTGRFTRVEHVGPTVNSPNYDGEPSISADGLALFFSSDRPGGRGGRDLWVATRPSTAASFGRPRNLGPKLNAPEHDVRPSVSADGATIHFMSDRPGGFGGIDLWRSERRAPPKSRRP